MTSLAAEEVRGPDWWGRGIGLVVFFLGISLLIAVFFWTSALGSLVPNPSQKLDLEAQKILAIRFGVEVARLFVSGLVASFIAGRGAQLYAAANRALSGD